MNSIIFFLSVCLYTGIPSLSQRRTAPHRTTLVGGTYGTDKPATTTLPQPPPTTVTQPTRAEPTAPSPSLAVITEPSLAEITEPSFATTSEQVPVTDVTDTTETAPTTAFRDSAYLSTAKRPAGPTRVRARVVPGGVVGAVPVPSVLSLASLGDEFGPSGGVTRKRNVDYTGKYYTHVYANANDNDESPGKTDAQIGTKKHVPIQNLCSEVEEILKPGSVQEECWTGDKVLLRYWQPYRALRSVTCKFNSNDTANVTEVNHDQCAAAYPGASCVQRYQQFVILASMGPASSGWACIRLPSGCGCSIRAASKLKKPDFEQRSDLRAFLET